MPPGQAHMKGAYGTTKVLSSSYHSPICSTESSSAMAFPLIQKTPRILSGTRSKMPGTLVHSYAIFTASSAGREP